MAECIQQLKSTAANQAEDTQTLHIHLKHTGVLFKSVPGCSCPVLKYNQDAGSIRIIADGACTLPLARFLCHFLMGFGHLTKGLSHLAVGFCE